MDSEVEVGAFIIRNGLNALPHVLGMGVVVKVVLYL